MLGSVGVGPAWAAWPQVGVTIGILGIALFILTQRIGLHWALALFERHFRSASSAAALRMLDRAKAVHQQLIQLHGKHSVLLRASGFHLVSWSLGAGEVYLILFAIGHPIGLAKAFIIESLGMAARSAGFAVPGSLGVQEGGLILVCGLFGIPADTAAALSMLKRLREIIVGVLGLAQWQWTEMQRIRAGAN
jgi:uncharacterized protein (TIRG00374 family)